MESPHYSQEAFMATDTLTKPETDGSTTKTKVFKNFIDGECFESAGGQTFQGLKPSGLPEVVAIFQVPNKDGEVEVVDAATRALAQWRLVAAPRRAETG